MSNVKEDIYLVNWEGPFTELELKTLTSKNNCTLSDARNKFWMLYSAYGSHQLYGNDVLLYLGKTTRRTTLRLNEHKAWFDDQRFGETKFLVASISDFKSWDDESDMEIKNHITGKSRVFYNKERSGDHVIEKVEALLIRTLTPVKNTSGTVYTQKQIGNVRLFNTGNIGAIPNEISGKYWAF